MFFAAEKTKVSRCIRDGLGADRLGFICRLFACHTRSFADVTTVKKRSARLITRDSSIRLAALNYVFVLTGGLLLGDLDLAIGLGWIFRLVTFGTLKNMATF